MSIMISNDLPARPGDVVPLDASLENYARSYAIRNDIATAPSPIAAYEFARAALDRDEVVGAASGTLDGQLYIWVYLDDLNIAATKSLFDLQASFEHRHQGTFEVHIDALQGRSLVDALPRDFQILQVR